MTYNSWFRMYHEILNDSFVQDLSFEDQRHYALGILALKCDGTVGMRDFMMLTASEYRVALPAQQLAINALFAD